MDRTSPATPRAPVALAGRIVIAAVAACLLLTGFGCKGVSQEVAQRTQPITLKIWRVFDDEDSIDDIINDYRKAHPNVFVDYRKLTYDEYEKALLSGLAEDNGPDIFSLHNDWLPAWKPRLLPLPPVLSVPYREVQGSIKKEYVTVIRQEPTVSLKQLANDYVDVVSDDVVLATENSDPRMPFVPKIYGLPLSVDTMVLYFNRDILNNAGIAQPATDWRTFQEQVKRITKLDQTGAIIQSAAAIGTADNVARSADILALLMMQNGAPMTNQNGQVTFDKYPPEMVGRPFPPGAEALIFYTDFANPEKEVYTWNDKMPGSLKAFIDGQTAYYFGYSYDLPVIRLSNAKLNFGISSFPQIEGNKPVNFANYWVEVVSNKTTHPNEAWDFVEFMTKASEAQKYLNVTKKPTALRSLINGQLEDLDLSVFASQVPTAKSWYHGTDATATEGAMTEMIRQMLGSEADPKNILQLGATKINQTIK
jgi:multiple sugar transport system substrate-binding protein